MRSKINREQDVIAFWNCLDKYPNTIPIKQSPPEPDFFADTEDGLIGIEHTSLVRPKDKRGVDLALHNSVAKEIVNHAWQDFQKKDDTDLIIAISFRCDYGLSRGMQPTWLHKDDIDYLKEEIVNKVSENIPKSGNWTFVHKYDKEGVQILPNKVEYIFINNVNGRFKSVWSPEQATIVPRLNLTTIKPTLEKKNTKPSNYLKDYSRVWLVIVEHSFQIETMFNFEGNDFSKNKIQTAFDRVFIYRLVENEIFELQTEAIK